jgi:hypothetical protein
LETTTQTTAAPTPQEILDAVAASLDVPTEITSSAGFFLFYTDDLVTCDWVSDNESVIDVVFIGGEAQIYQTNIHRPARTDVIVTLTATLSYQFVTRIITFAIVVRAENNLLDLLQEDVDLLTVGEMEELSIVELPLLGHNGSEVSWTLQGTDYAELNIGTLTLKYAGTNHIIVLMATLWLDAMSDTKFFFVEVQVRSYATIDDILSHPLDAVFVKATVYFFYSKGFFVFDETGLLNVYADIDWSDRVHLGDEIVLSGNRVNGYVGYELWYPNLEAIVSSNNPYDLPTQEYIFGVSFPRPFQLWVITGQIQVINSIVYVYSGQVRIAIIELSTYNDSYNALKAHDGQMVSFVAANYYFYSTCYGFLYQEGESGITVIG